MILVYLKKTIEYETGNIPMESHNLATNSKTNIKMMEKGNTNFISRFLSNLTFEFLFVCV